MQWCKDCDCNRKIIDFDSIEFKIDGSRIDLQCVICNGLIGCGIHKIKRLGHRYGHGQKKNEKILQ
jgi:hypothetical protein